MFHLISLICVALLIHIPPQMKFYFFKLFPLILFYSSSAKWPNPRVLSHPEFLSRSMGDSQSHPRNIWTPLKFYLYAKFHEQGHCGKMGTCSPWSSSKHPFLEGSQNSGSHREKLQWGQWLRKPRQAFHRGFYWSQAAILSCLETEQLWQHYSKRVEYIARGIPNEMCHNKTTSP